MTKIVSLMVSRQPRTHGLIRGFSGLLETRKDQGNRMSTNLFDVLQRAFQGMIEFIAGSALASGNAVLTAKSEPTGAEPKPFSECKYLVRPATADHSAITLRDAPLYVAANGGTVDLLEQAIKSAAAKCITVVTEGKVDPVKGTMKGRPSDAAKAQADALFDKFFPPEVKAEFPALIRAAKQSKGATLIAFTLSNGIAEIAVRVSARNPEQGPSALYAFAVATGLSIKQDGVFYVKDGKITRTGREYLERHVASLSKAELEPEAQAA